MRPCKRKQARGTLGNGPSKRKRSGRHGNANVQAHGSVSGVTAVRASVLYRRGMAHTYTSNLVHCVFSTYERANLIRDPERLWQYLTGVARGKGMATLAVGGTENHVHALVVLPPTVAVAKAVQELKGNSSKWMNEIGRGFRWQRGYGAFSVSESGKDAVVAYFRGQAEHHRKWTFEQEYVSLLKKYKIEYDPRYVFD